MSNYQSTIGASATNNNMMIQEDMNLSLDAEQHDVKFDPQFAVFQTQDSNATIELDAVDNAKKHRDILAMSPKKNDKTISNDGSLSTFR